MSMKDLLASYALSKNNKPEFPKEKVVPDSQNVIRLLRSQLNHINEAAVERTATLGILFIIIDSFPNEALWRLWLLNKSCNTRIDESNSDKLADVKIWFHAKFPQKIKSDWVRSRLVKHFHYQPDWGSVDLTKVMLYMLKEATDEAPYISKFVFASESCIPVVPLNRVISDLYSSSSNSQVRDAATASCDERISGESGGPDAGLPDLRSSWLHYHDKSKCNGYSVGPQFETMEQSIPSECVFKADQWIALSRTHALQILSFMDRYEAEMRSLKGSGAGDCSLFSLFGRAKASDELFFASCLSMLGHINKEKRNSSDDTLVTNSDSGSGSGGAVLNRLVTYCDWSANEKRPRTFTPTQNALLSPQDAQFLRASAALFLRKIQLPICGVGSRYTVSDQMQFVESWLQLMFDSSSDVCPDHRAMLNSAEAVLSQCNQHIATSYSSSQRITTSFNSYLAHNNSEIRRFTGHRETGSNSGYGYTQQQLDHQHNNRKRDRDRDNDHGGSDQRFGDSRRHSRDRESSRHGSYPDNGSLSDQRGSDSGHDRKRQHWN